MSAGRQNLRAKHALSGLPWLNDRMALQGARRTDGRAWRARDGFRNASCSHTAFRQRPQHASVYLFMKILHVISSVDLRGGGPIEAVRQLAVAHARAGHITEVACIDGPDAGEAGRVSFRHPQARAGAHALSIQPSSVAVAARARAALRRRRRQRLVAIRQLRHVARVQAHRHAVLRVHARHARSLVQAHVPGETSEEMAVLAVGRLPRVARRARRAVHLRRGAPARAAVVLAVPLQRSRGQFRHCGASRQCRRTARSVRGALSGNARQEARPLF